MQHGNVSRVLVRERPRHTRETRRPPRAPHGANPSMAPKRGSKVQKVSHETRAPTRGSKKTRRIEETPNILTRSIFFLPLLYVNRNTLYTNVWAPVVWIYTHKRQTAFLYVYCRSQVVGDGTAPRELTPRELPGRCDPPVATRARRHPPSANATRNHCLRADPNTAIQLVRGASLTQ